MAEVASAYVTLLPSFRGGAAAISKELDGPVGQAGVDGGKAYGTGMTSGIAGMARSILGPLAVAAGGAALVGFFKGAVDEASGLNESINALNVSYGESSAGVQALGKEAATALGLSNLEFNNLAVRFSSFSKTIAGDGGDVTGTLDNLTTRASDFASVMNLDVNEAAQLFQSGLAGESEPLRKFGLDMSAASVEAYGLANGIAANGTSLTEAEKVQARYGLLMEQTAATQGDFANTSDQLANQQRILAAKFDDTKARIGSALLPAMTGLVSFVSSTMLPALDDMGAFLTDTLIPGFQSLAQFVGDNAVPIGIVAGLITAVFLPALIAMGVQATISAAKQVAAWIATQASAIAGAAAQSLAIARTVAGWVLMGAQSLIQAARMAAAWLIAMGPVGIIIAIVVGLVALIIANWDTIVAWTKQAWENVTAWLATAWENITSGVTSAWNGILDFFRAIPGAIVNFFMNWTLIGLLISHWDSIKATAVRIWDALVTFITGIPGRFVAGLAAIGTTVRDSVSGWVTEIKDGAVEKFTTLIDWVTGIPDRLLDGLGNLGDILKNAGIAIITGLWDGLKEKWGDVQEWVGGIGDWIAEHKGPRAYDLALLRPAGGWIMTGLRESIEDEIPALLSTLDKVSGAIAVDSNLAGVGWGGANANGRGSGDGGLIDYDRLASTMTRAMSRVQLPLDGRNVALSVDQRIGERLR